MALSVSCRSRNLTFAPPFSILVLSSTPTTSSRTLPLRSTWNVMVRWPTALITPSTSTALVFVALADSPLAASVFAGAGAGAGAALGAAAGFGAGFSSTELQPTPRATATAMLASQKKPLDALFIESSSSQNGAAHLQGRAIIWKIFFISLNHTSVSLVKATGHRREHIEKIGEKQYSYFRWTSYRRSEKVSPVTALSTATPIK